MVAKHAEPEQIRRETGESNWPFVSLIFELDMAICGLREKGYGKGLLKSPPVFGAVADDIESRHNCFIEDLPPAILQMEAVQLTNTLHELAHELAGLEVDQISPLEAVRA